MRPSVVCYTIGIVICFCLSSCREDTFDFPEAGICFRRGRLNDLDYLMIGRDARSLTDTLFYYHLGETRSIFFYKKNDTLSFFSNTLRNHREVDYRGTQFVPRYVTKWDLDSSLLRVDREQPVGLRARSFIPHNFIFIIQYTGVGLAREDKSGRIIAWE